jgi:hypothetical protein
MESEPGDCPPRAGRQSRDTSLAGALFEACITGGEGGRVEADGVGRFRRRRVKEGGFDALPKELRAHRLRDEVSRVYCQRGIERLQGANAIARIEGCTRFTDS